MSSYGDPDPAVETTAGHDGSGQPDSGEQEDTTSGGAPEEPTTQNPQQSE